MAYNVAIQAYGDTTTLTVNNWEDPPQVVVKVRRLGSWVEATPKRYNASGSEWEPFVVKVRDSGQWKG